MQCGAVRCGAVLRSAVPALCLRCVVFVPALCRARARAVLVRVICRCECGCGAAHDKAVASCGIKVYGKEYETAVCDFL